VKTKAIPAILLIADCNVFPVKYLADHNT